AGWGGGGGRGWGGGGEGEGGRGDGRRSYGAGDRMEGSAVPDAPARARGRAIPERGVGVASGYSMMPAGRGMPAASRAPEDKTSALLAAGEPKKVPASAERVGSPSKTKEHSPRPSL